MKFIHLRQVRGWLMRLVGLLHRNRRERDFAEELESHLAFHIEDNLRAGMSPEEARRVAFVKLGGVTQVQELHREQRGLPMLETLFQDLRYGVRMLRKHPGFTLIAVLTLALGIGANTAIFSVFNAVLLRPLPFKEPERLVMVWQVATAAGGNRTPFPVNTLLDLRTQSKSFTELAAFVINNLNFTGGEMPEQVRTALVTANFFTALGVEPQLGRTFLPQEEQVSAGTVVILSDGFWRSHFAADPAVVGRAINLSGRSFTVIGVMPPALNFPEKEVALWSQLPLQLPALRAVSPLHGVARLQPGVTVAQALAETRTLKSSFDQKAYNMNLVPVNDYVVGDVRPALLALLVAVTLLLLIAAVNVANLTLVRAAARVKEISLRTALGAGRGRIIRQLLTESLLLVLLGGAAGVLDSSAARDAG